MQMSGGKFLLDTNIITAWMKGEKEIADHIEKASVVYIPIIVLGELYYGAAYSTQVQKNTAAVRKLSGRYKVLLIDEAFTIEYGKVKAALRAKGSPIPENDIWIAAIALRNNLALVTRDKHFNEVGGLKLKAW
jgi:tRNA(fMet)-specific endonuclease VapC